MVPPSWVVVFSDVREDLLASRSGCFLALLRLDFGVVPSSGSMFGGEFSYMSGFSRFFDQIRCILQFCFVNLLIKLRTSP